MGELVRKLIREKLEGFSIDKLKDMLVECLVDKSVEEFENICKIDKTVKFAVYKYLGEKQALYLVSPDKDYYAFLAPAIGEKNKLYTNFSNDWKYCDFIYNAVCYVEFDYKFLHAEACCLLGYIDDFPHYNYAACLAIIQKFLPDVQMTD